MEHLWLVTCFLWSMTTYWMYLLIKILLLFKNQTIWISKESFSHNRPMPTGTNSLEISTNIRAVMNTDNNKNGFIGAKTFLNTLQLWNEIISINQLGNDRSNKSLSRVWMYVLYYRTLTDYRTPSNPEVAIFVDAFFVLRRRRRWRTVNLIQSKQFVSIT